METSLWFRSLYAVFKANAGISKPRTHSVYCSMLKGLSSFLSQEVPIFVALCDCFQTQDDESGITQGCRF